MRKSVDSLPTAGIVPGTRKLSLALFKNLEEATSMDLLFDDREP